MKMRTLTLSILACVLWLNTNQAAANTLNDNPVPLGHCYHWLQTAPGYLDFKYDYAKNNGNELTFYTSPATSNGSVAGPGLYCAKSPSQSYGYGNRVIRIELVDDIVVYDEQSGRNYCGHDGRWYANDKECQSKDWDIKLYNRNPDWYVIQNPRAVKSWSATTPQLIEDLNAETRYADGGFRSHVQTTISAINAEVAKSGVRDMVNARARMGFAEIVKDEKLLRSLPALTILGEFNRPENKKIDAQLMAKILQQTVKRILEDDYLPWADVKPVLKSATIKQAFTAEIQRQLAGLSGKSNDKKNFDVMLMYAGQKGSGITAEQIKTLIAETFKNPSNFGQTRFAKGDLSEELKAGLIAELNARLAVPGTKNDLGLLASLVTFVSINNINAKIKTDVTAMYYEFLKSMTASKFSLADRKNKYPLGDTTQIAVQLCQANIAAYNLVNKDLSIVSGDVAVGVGQLSKISNAASFCQQQASLMDVLATLPKKGDAPLQTVRGHIEGVTFKFVVIDSESTEAQLRSFLARKNISSAQNVLVRMNDETIFSYSNYYALPDQDTIVATVLSAVNTKGVFARNQLSGLAAIAEKSKGKSKKVEVTFSDVSPVTFKIDTVEDFNEQCELLAPTLNQNEISNVSLKYKDNEVSLGSISLKDAKLLCGVARQALFNWKIPSLAAQKNAAELARLRNGKKKNLNVTFGDSEVVLSFKINTIEDFEAQCLLQSPILENYPVVDVGWNLNDGDSSDNYTSDPFTSTTTDTCTGLIGSLMNNEALPSTRAINALKQLKALATGKKMNATVYFENLEVPFGIDSIEDFTDQCPIIEPALKGRVVTAVGTQLNDDNRSFVSGPFATSKDMCDAAKAALLDKGVPSRKHAGLIAQLGKAASGKPYQLPLNIQGTEVLFGVNNMEELVSQCQYLGDIFDGRNVETIVMPVKGTDGVDISPSSALKSTKEVCDFIRESFVEQVPSKVVADIAAKKSQSRYSFIAILDSLPLTFALNSMKEFDKQCATLVKASGKSTVYKIGMKKDENWSPRSGFRGGSDASDICAVIKSVAEAGFITSEEQEDVLAIQRRKHIVEATLEGLPFTFKVDSRDQLVGQCLNLTDRSKNFEDGIYNIQFRVNGGKITTLDDLDLDIKSACRYLAKAVKF